MAARWVARMIGRPHTAGDELRFALAGPMVTAVIALAFGALAPALPASTPSAVRGLVGYETQVNLLILGFNLVPAFPLDGGRVARALLWRRTSDVRRATEIASAIGRGFGYLLVGGGVFLWFAVRARRPLVRCRRRVRDGGGERGADAGASRGHAHRRECGSGHVAPRDNASCRISAPTRPQRVPARWPSGGCRRGRQTGGHRLGD